MPEIINWTYEPNEGYMKAVRLYQNVVGQFDLYMGMWLPMWPVSTTIRFLWNRQT